MVSINSFAIFAGTRYFGYLVPVKYGKTIYGDHLKTSFFYYYLLWDWYI